MKTALSILVLSSGLFWPTLDGTVKAEHFFDDISVTSVIPQEDAVSHIKQSTTETVVLPDVLELSFTGADVDKIMFFDPSAKRWMATAMFRSYWDYRDTSYMIDSLHFLVEKFFFDTVGALEGALVGRSLTSEQQSRTTLKILEQQMGKDGKFWFFGASADDEWPDDQCEESTEVPELSEVVDETPEENTAEAGLSAEELYDDGAGLLDLVENDNEPVSALTEEEAGIVADQEEMVNQDHGQDRPTFSNVVDFYHIVLHRIAHLLTPEGAQVCDTMRVLEIDLMLALHNIARHYDQQVDLDLGIALDEEVFAKIKEAYGAMLLAGRDFLHGKLRTAWSPTIRIVDSIVQKTGKNLDGLNYFDFEQWLNDQQQ